MLQKKEYLFWAPPLYDASQQCLFRVVGDIGAKAIGDFLVVTIRDFATFGIVIPGLRGSRM